MPSKNELRAEISALRRNLADLIVEREGLIGDVLDAKHDVEAAEARGVEAGKEIVRLEIERYLFPNRIPRTGPPPTPFAPYPLPFPLPPVTETEDGNVSLDWYDGEDLSDEC